MPARLLIALAALALGFAWTGFSALMYASASIPYPDPTPALLASQAASMRGWGWATVAGAVLAAVALLALLLGSRRRTRAPR
jgi:hypothetical protein